MDQCFLPLNIISSVFGISYLHETKSKSLQIFSKLYTLTVCTVLFVSFLYRISSVLPQFCQPDAVSTSVMGIQEILATFVVTTIYYQVLFNQNQFRSVQNLISTADTRFSMLNIRFPSKNFERKIFIEVTTVIGFICMAFIFFVVYYKVHSIGLILLEFFSSIAPMVVIILNLMIFSDMAWLIRNRFRMLKHFLVDVCAVGTLIADESNIEVWKVKLTRETPSGLHRELNRIAKIYELLFCAVNHLNDIFGLSNLTSMGKFYVRSIDLSAIAKMFSKFIAALFSITLTCHLFLLFKLLTENTNNMNGIQFHVLGTFVTVQLNQIV